MAEPMELQSKALAIAEAQSGKHVLDIVEAQLRRMGATHILVTGLPMPNRRSPGWFIASAGRMIVRGASSVPIWTPMMAR